MSKLLGHRSVRSGFVDLAWKRDRHSREDDSFSVLRYNYVIVVSVSYDDFSIKAVGFGIAIDSNCLIEGAVNRERDDGRVVLPLMRKIDSLRIRRPHERANPRVELFRQILLLPRLAVVQHQLEAVALVSRTLLGAVGDVAAIGRIERRRVAGRIFGR